MLDKNLIKMHQVLLGLFQGKMVLSLCRKGPPELYKALLMAAGGKLTKNDGDKHKDKSSRYLSLFFSLHFLAPPSPRSAPRRFSLSVSVIKAGRPMTQVPTPHPDMNSGS